jgi:peptide-methionine (S)-S-oxide reductase
MKALVILAVLGSAVWFGFSASQTAAVAKSTSGNRPGDIGKKMDILKAARERGHDLAIFAGGCFWGFESSFRQQKGVVATAVGYTGGKVANPTYEQVCSKDTGHAEAVLVEFDPKKTSYEELVRAFFKFHDPTQVNRQGPDFGSNYRSALFYFDEDQEKAAFKVREELQKDKYKAKPIATQFAKASEFWMAEDYHQQYYEKKGIAPACAIGG